MKEIKYMLPVFIIPSENNTISENDLGMGYLRITVEYKSYFPTLSQEVFVTIGSKSQLIKFTYRENKSHLLHIGQGGIDSLTLSDGERVCFEVIGEFRYRLSKLVP